MNCLSFEVIAAMPSRGRGDGKSELGKIAALLRAGTARPAAWSKSQLADRQGGPRIGRGEVQTVDRGGH
jgi:hypothetical protein